MPHVRLQLENYSTTAKISFNWEKYTNIHVDIESSPGYSVLYQIPEGETSNSTIYDQEMLYGQTVKPSQTTHNVAH